MRLEGLTLAEHEVAKVREALVSLGLLTGQGQDRGG